MRERFDKTKRQGDLPPDGDPAVLPAYILAVTHSIAVQAKAGLSQGKLTAIARLALSTWHSA